MGLDEAPAQGQPDAAAPGGGLALLVLLEDALLLGGRDAGSGVVDAHADPLVVGGDPDVDAAAARRELHRVAEEVPRDLAEPQRVGVGEDGGRWPVEPKRDARLARPRPDEELGVADGVGHVDAVHDEVELARLDLGHVEQLVDEEQEVAAGAGDVVDVALLAPGERADEAVAQHVGEARPPR